jgi:hypothetical protein
MEFISNIKLNKRLMNELHFELKPYFKFFLTIKIKVYICCI